MDRPVRVAFDIGGVLSKYPVILQAMAQALHDGGAEVFVITDMQDPDRVLELLEANGFGFINPANIICADFERTARAARPWCSSGSTSTCSSTTSPPT